MSKVHRVLEEQLASFRSAQEYANLRFKPQDRVKLQQTIRSQKRCNILDMNRKKDPNYWAMLADECEEYVIGSDKAEVQVKVEKPPPISVYKVKMSDIKPKILAIEKMQSEVNFKIMYDSIQVITQCIHDYTLVISYLNSSCIEYTTHPLKGDRNVKICLFGLPEMDTKDIVNELKRFNVVPFDIKVITPRTNYGGGARIYLLFFKRKDGIKISSLRNITGLMNIRVKWEYYVPRKHAPTQCSRCQNFGHGALNCRKSFRCVSCGEDHDSKTCPNRKPVITSVPMDPPPKPRVPNDQVKCANCGQNHTATFANCQIRINYQQRVARARSKVKTKNPLPPTQYKEQFPLLQPPHDTSYMQQHFQSQSSTVREPVQADNNSVNFSLISELLHTQQQLITTMMTSLLNQMLDKMEKMFDNMLQKISSNKSTV